MNGFTDDQTEAQRNSLLSWPHRAGKWWNWNLNPSGSRAWSAKTDLRLFRQLKGSDKACRDESLREGADSLMASPAPGQL